MRPRASGRHLEGRNGHPTLVPRIRDDDQGLRRYLESVKAFPMLDRSEELRLARTWLRHRDRRAADALVKANLRYVVVIARKYRGYGLPIADLVEEGNVGLLEAIDRYDPARKVRFMTYAAYWIRAYILAHVLRYSSITGLGTGPVDSKLFFGLRRQRARLSAELGASDAIDTALAERFKTSEDRIRRMTERLNNLHRDSSLDAPVWREGATCAADLLRDSSADQEEQLGAAERDAQVRAVLGEAWGGLDAREKIIVRERLLEDREDAPTLAALGRRLGVSRERVRQLEERVKGKLRHALAGGSTPLRRAA